MSALTRKDERMARSTAPSSPLDRADATRVMVSRIRGPPAPCADSLPTSSWSNSAMARTPVSSAREPGAVQVSSMACRDRYDMHRLSRRPASTNSSVAPPRVAGCTSHTCSSKSRMSAGATPSCCATISSRSEWCLLASCALSAAAAADSPPADVLAGAAAAGLSSCALAAVASTGAKLVCRLGLNPAEWMSRCRWMASMGMRRMGRSMRTRRCWICSPSPPRTSTRPARPRSRSNQVYHSPPPYVSTLIMSHPLLDDLLTGLSLRQGLSVCAPIMKKPLPGTYFSPTAKAQIVDMLRVKKYLPPGFTSQAAFSLMCWKPACMSRLLASSTAW
mmetsp:Transcript_27700/g.70576  ORF Transcript_27700/g.70576 Transcript_27700/m.70576 type:complete len:333 (-) Transcript_27700:270-1268(-)